MTSKIEKVVGRARPSGCEGDFGFFVTKPDCELKQFATMKEARVARVTHVATHGEDSADQPRKLGGR